MTLVGEVFRTFTVLTVLGLGFLLGVIVGVLLSKEQSSRKKVKAKRPAT